MNKPHLVLRTVLTLLIILIMAFAIIYGFSSDHVDDKVMACCTTVACAGCVWIINREYRF